MCAAGEEEEGRKEGGGGGGGEVGLAAGVGVGLQRGDGRYLALGQVGERVGLSLSTLSRGWEA